MSGSELLSPHSYATRHEAKYGSAPSSRGMDIWRPRPDPAPFGFAPDPLNFPGELPEVINDGSLPGRPPAAVPGGAPGLKGMHADEENVVTAVSAGKFAVGPGAAAALTRPDIGDSASAGAGSRARTAGSTPYVRKAREDIPRDFLCPITQMVMQDPVTTVDGMTFERRAIETWLARHYISPMTGMGYGSKILIANNALRERIEYWLETGPDRKALLRRHAKEQFMDFAIKLREHQVCDFGNEKLRAEIPRVLRIGESVRQLLKKLGMEMYYSKFREWGYDQMQFLVHAKEEHLVDMGMKLGHRQAILSAIHDIKLMVDARDRERDLLYVASLSNKAEKKIEDIRAEEKARIKAKAKARKEQFRIRERTPREKSRWLTVAPQMEPEDEATLEERSRRKKEKRREAVRQMQEARSKFTLHKKTKAEAHAAGDPIGYRV